MLDIWPITLPIKLRVRHLQDSNEDNVIATFKHKDRICEIHVQAFNVMYRERKESFDRVTTSMQVPFPVLTHLYLENFDDPSPPLPDSFLGGSAPGLRLLHLHGFAVLGLPNLLLSATSLIHLLLDDIPDNRYISPYVMADCLSSLARLEYLRIGFISQVYPYQTDLRPPPLTRTTLRAFL